MKGFFAVFFRWSKVPAAIWTLSMHTQWWSSDYGRWKASHTIFWWPSRIPLWNPHRGKCFF